MHGLTNVLQQKDDARSPVVRRSITVLEPDEPTPNPPAGSVMTNAQIVQSWLDQLCTAGGWRVDTTSGAVSSSIRDTFCGPRRTQGSAHWQTSGAPTSCRCLCQATEPGAPDIRIRTEDVFTVGEERVDVVGGGEGATLHPGPGRPETHVGVTGRSKTQPGVGETGSSAGAGRVNQPAWLIFGHEVCGHVLMGRNGHHEMTPSGEGSAVDIENRIRREHSTIGASLGIRKGEFRADENEDGMNTIGYEGSLYIVQRGESLLGIARRCGIPRSSIPGHIFDSSGQWISESEIDSVDLEPDMMLLIAGVFWHEVIKDETVSAIARQWGVPTRSVCRANVGYTIRTWRRNRWTTRRFNDCNRIYPGDLLLIPAS